MDFDDECFEDEGIELSDEINQPRVQAPPPQEYPSRMMEEASKISGGEWQDYYKKRMGETYQRGFALIQEDESNVLKWDLLTSNNEGLHPVLLFERKVVEGEPSSPYKRIFKVSTVVKGRGERFMWIIRDHDHDTRLAWDSRDVSSVQQLETYRPEEGDMDVVKCEVRSPYPLLMGNRLLLGVQQVRYNADFKTHTYVYHTATHYYYTDHFKETIHKNCSLVPNALVCVWLSPMEHGEWRLKMVVCVDAGNLWAAAPMVNASYPERLCERVLLWQRVVNEWDTYYGRENDPKLIENRK
jgi:hypothetical protein